MELGLQRLDALLEFRNVGHCDSDGSACWWICSVAQAVSGMMSVCVYAVGFDQVENGFGDCLGGTQVDALGSGFGRQASSRGFGLS